MTAPNARNLKVRAVRICSPRRSPRGPALALACALALLAGQAMAQVSDRDYFRTNCAVCHTIGGGRLIGPDLAGVETRQERAWLVEFIVDPQSKLGTGDPYALKLLAEANNVPMVAAPGITAERARALLDLVALEVSSGGTDFAGPKQLREATAADLALGEQLFSGRSRLAAGGPACIGCHTVTGLGGLGGGRLGPDLTQVNDRLGGAAGLTAWLQAPPTAQMQATFGNRPFSEDEVIALAAYLTGVAGRPESSILAGMNASAFLFMGALGALAILVIFGGAWSGRLRGVRHGLVRRARKNPKRVGLNAGGQHG